MYEFYRLLVCIFSPLIAIWFYFRCLIGKDKVESVCNHFGVPTTERPEGRMIWIHAASIGESNAALTYVRHLKKNHPDINVVFTTITLTSANLLLPKIQSINGCIHQFVVADNHLWVKKFLDYWKIDVAIFLESEIWPVTMYALKKRNIPAFLISGRLSEKSFRRWKVAEDFFASILSKYNMILAQSDLDKKRFQFFAKTNNVISMDNLKYSNPPLICDEQLLAICKKIFEGKKVLVAASTHEKEEDIILEAHKLLIEKGIDLITVIIPRHLTRVKDVCNTIKRHELSYVLRSEINLQNDGDVCNCLGRQIVCVDTFGDVGTFFRIADVCFVGGTLVPIGGHNIYEPVALGKPVLHGKHMNNGLETRDFLKSKNVAFEVNGPDDIRDAFCRLIQQREAISELCLAATKNEALNQVDSVIEQFLGDAK